MCSLEDLMHVLWQLLAAGRARSRSICSSLGRSSIVMVMMHLGSRIAEDGFHLSTKPRRSSNGGGIPTGLDSGFARATGSLAPASREPDLGQSGAETWGQPTFP